MHYMRAAAALAAALASGSAAAELIDRGGGLVYDTVLGVTWLQNANVALSACGSADGRLVWAAALTCAADYVHQDPVRNRTWDDWRLPRALPVNGVAYNDTFAFNGTTDNGYNITSTRSELAHLFAVSLGNLSALTTTGSPRPGQNPPSGLPGVDWGLVNSGPFLNAQLSTYWTENVRAGTSPAQSRRYSLLFGQQNSGTQTTEHFVWLVRDGDVGPAPPATTKVPMAPLHFWAAAVVVGLMARRALGRRAL